MNYPTVYSASCDVFIPFNTNRITQLVVVATCGTAEADTFSDVFRVGVNISIGCINTLVSRDVLRISDSFIISNNRIGCI